MNVKYGRDSSKNLVRLTVGIAARMMAAQHKWEHQKIQAPLRHCVLCRIRKYGAILIQCLAWLM